MNNNKCKNNTAKLFNAAVEFKHAQSISTSSLLAANIVANQFINRTLENENSSINIDLFATINKSDLFDDMTGLTTEINPGVYKNRLYYLIDSAKVKSISSINDFMDQICNSDPACQKNPFILGILVDDEDEIAKEYNVQICNNLHDYIESYGT